MTKHRTVYPNPDLRNTKPILMILICRCNMFLKEFLYTAGLLRLWYRFILR